ncbi:hypothetical protein DID88_009697 [Monilinia fructigena]|uniref:mannan endo-1,6-alpha-mannosidase n=1 Tax=Monilinia fructigena TaxID=38457 RepID=A0A395IDP5_9HELO|nr:hypothetical protein DID88_009697 [Monilinia fructigena]
MISTKLSRGIILALPIFQSVSGLALDTSDPTSIKNAAGTIAYGLMKYYTGNVTNTPDTIAVLPAPYYWWEAGAMWGSMIDYYHYTGDSSYNDVTKQALESQVGPLFDYMMPNHQKDEGNDDQAFWGFATMSAAEKNFPEPSNTGGFTWVQLTENLWNTQAARWDTSSCGGGLKWQIFSFNNGYTYKNSVSNGAFFQLSARLARYTGNQTYADWAEKVYDWTTKIGLIDAEFNVFDGADDTKGCTDPNEITWTYNNAIFLYGSAVMYNHTTDSAWKSRTESFLKASANFFTSDNVMYEQACETVGTCNNDQYSFKAYLSRFMWATTQMAPFTKNTITTYLTKSASAAAGVCTGDGHACGAKWYTGSSDKILGVGQQMGALEVIQGLLVSSAAPPIVKGQALVQAPSYSTSSAPTSASSTSIVSSSSKKPTVASASSVAVTASSTRVIEANTIETPLPPSTPASSEETPSSTTSTAPAVQTSTAISSGVSSPARTPSSAAQTPSEVYIPSALPSSTIEPSSAIVSAVSSATSLTTPAPVFDTTTTVHIIHSTTVSCSNSSVYANSTSWFAPSSFLSSHRTTALSTSVTAPTHSSASSKSSTALLIDTSTQPTPKSTEASVKGTSIAPTAASAAAAAATTSVSAAVGRNMRVPGTGLVAGMLGAGLLYAF